MQNPSRKSLALVLVLVICGTTAALLARSADQQNSLPATSRINTRGIPQNENEAKEAMAQIAALPPPTISEVHVQLRNQFYPNGPNVEHVWWGNMLMVPFSSPAGTAITNVTYFHCESVYGACGHVYECPDLGKCNGHLYGVTFSGNSAQWWARTDTNDEAILFFRVIYQ